MRKVITLLLVTFLLGCYTGTVKPLLSDREFQAENQPIRTLKTLLITDGTFRKEEIEKFVLKCSSLVEMQIGVRLEMTDWYQIEWGNERNDLDEMMIKSIQDTWVNRDKFDISVAFVHFDHRIEGTKEQVGAIDTLFWRYIFVKHLNPNILLHELFHAFLLEKSHSDEWVMRSEMHQFGNEWFWLTPKERRIALGNKWRDFNTTPTTGGKKKSESMLAEFYYYKGEIYTRRNQFDRAISNLNKALEIDAQHAKAHFGLGVLYYERKEYSQAISCLDKAIELDPGNALAYFIRGAAFTSKREYDKAWNDINKSQELGHKIPPGFLNALRKASGRNK